MSDTELKLYETAVLTSYPLSQDDVDAINTLIAERVQNRERHSTRSLIQNEQVTPSIFGTIITGRAFEADLRPDSIAKHYPKEERTA